MKLLERVAPELPLLVVPYIGTWIETEMPYEIKALHNVVPYIGTWIETVNAFQQLRILMSYLI